MTASSRSGAPNRTYEVKLVRGPFVRLPAHPDAISEPSELPRIAKKLKRPLAADLFCGAGGMSLGLTAAGFDVVLGVDHDDEALETHRAHHPGLSVNWDLSDPEVVEQVADLIGDLDVTLLAGGPPCQPFSKAGRYMLRELVRSGRREAHDGRRDLWQSFLQVIALSRPPAVLMENVPDMALDRNMLILRTMVEELEVLGYSVEERVVETRRYGVPQFRQRLILVALRDGSTFEWPVEAPDEVTVENAIGDLPEVDGGWRPSNGDGQDPVASGWAEYGPKRSSDFARWARRNVPSTSAGRVYDHITRPVREDDLEAFKVMTHETRYSQLDESLKRYRDDIFDDKYKRLNPNDVSRTITAHIAKDGYWYIHPFQHRTLTVREAARLQTFGDDIRFAGPPSAQFRQIGNAVPPLLAEHLGHAILRSLKKPRPPAVPTRTTAVRLADWFAEAGSSGLPWLRSDNRWVVLQGEILWGRMAADLIRSAYSSIERLESPAETLRVLPLLRSVATGFGRAERVALVEETATWFEANPEALDDEASVSALAAAPNVSPTIAEFVTRVVPGVEDDPVLAGYGVLRVAARYFGEPVDLKNRGSDGRLAVARMIGGDEDIAHDAHLGLIELAQSICTSEAPRCADCPLLESCRTAPARHMQAVDLTSRARRPKQGPKLAPAP